MSTDTGATDTNTDTDTDTDTDVEGEPDVEPEPETCQRCGHPAALDVTPITNGYCWVCYDYLFDHLDDPSDDPGPKGHRGDGS